MQCPRFAQSVVLAIGLAASAACMAVQSNDDRSGVAASAEPLFHRFVVAPGDDPSVLPMNTDGAQLIEIDRTGALLVHNGPVVRRQQRPRAYQDIGGRRREVSVRFEIAPTGPPRLVVGAYDAAFPLTVDSEKRGSKP
jgi:hypothetical protein